MAALSTVLGQIRSHESGSFAGNYALTPQQNVAYPQSHASGAYQFEPATWAGYTAQSGIGTQYAQAYQAPPQVQDAVAAWVVTNKGTGDWTPYSGAVSPVTSIDVTPNQLLQSSGAMASPNTSLTQNDPLLGGGVDPVTGQPDWILPEVGTTAGSPTGVATTGTASGTGAGTGTPVAVGLQPSTVQQIGSWVQAPITAFENWATTQFDQLGNWFTRGFLIILAIVIVAIALWHVAGKPNPAVLMEAAA